MSQASDPQASDPQAAGPAGTARIDIPGAGPAGTARIDTPGAGPAGTARIDIAQAGPAGTARIDPTDAGPAGTARLAAPADQAGTAASGPDDSAVQWLRADQVLTLNGQSNRVLHELTHHTSEARTYVAEASNGAQVVVKLYRPGFRAKQQVLQRLRALPHRNVVGVLDMGTADGRDVEVMEYITGGTLDQHLRRHGPIRDTAVLRRLTAGMADGLDHLHDTVGLIYQDLKPENVLLDGADFERVVLADFGISTLRTAGSLDVQVTANGTREYAAPELSRFGNQTDAFVTEKVDYFALGITLLECWQGARPFQGVPDGRRIQQLQDKEVPFPLDIDKSLETLIKGLVYPGVKERFGRAEVRRWIDGQSLQVDYASSRRTYQRRVFLGSEYFETPAQLAALLEKYPDKGEDHLYLGSIQKWLDACDDMELSTEVTKIVRLFDRDAASRRAGLLRAIYTLDVDRPFVSQGGRRAATEEDFAEFLLAEKDHYLKALIQPEEPFYLYLQARGEQDFATETLGRFMSQAPAELSFNSVIFNLQSGGRNRLRIAGQDFYLPEELVQAPPAVRDEVARQATQFASLLLIWLQRLSHVEKVDAVQCASPVDQMGLLRALPWLRLKDLVPDWADRQGPIAVTLIARHRADLLPTFAAQGLDFNADAGKWRPLVIASFHHSLDLMRFLLDHGARLDEPDSYAWLPLGGAVVSRRLEAIDLLLSRGADVNATDGVKRTVLELACLPQDADRENSMLRAQVIGRLLAAGADPNQPGSQGLPPLHLAMQQSGPSDAAALVGQLLEAGANPRRTGPNAWVAIQPDMDAWAAALFASHYVHHHHADFLPVLKMLLKAGTRVDALYAGKAALHWAAAWGSEPLARALLELGSSVDQVADDDMLPGTYAQLERPTALLPLLQPGPRWAAQARWQSLSNGLLQSLLLALALLNAVGLNLQFRLSSGGSEAFSFQTAWFVSSALTLAVQLGLVSGNREFLLNPRAHLLTRYRLALVLVAGPAALGVAGYLLERLTLSGLSLFGVFRLRTWVAVEVWLSFGLALALAGWLVLRQRRQLPARQPWTSYLQAAVLAKDATAVAADIKLTKEGRLVALGLLGVSIAAAPLLMLPTFDSPGASFSGSRDGAKPSTAGPRDLAGRSAAEQGKTGTAPAASSAKASRALSLRADGQQAQARAMLAEAVAAGDPAAFGPYAWMLLGREGAAAGAQRTNDAEVQALVRRALAMNPTEPWAMATEGMMLAEGWGVRRDLDAGMRRLEQAANAGVGPAMHALGMYYINVKRQPQQARQWFGRAAALGQPGDQYNLGLMDWLGEAAPRPDRARAMQLWKQAAAKGEPRAVRAVALGRPPD